MFIFLSPIGSRPSVFRLPVCLGLAVLLLGTVIPPSCAQEVPTRLIDRQPFDRVTLNEANGNQAIDTLLLDLPNRTLPAPFPSSGSLELRRLSEPSVLYTVAWTSISRIQLYEQLLLAESIKLTEARDLEPAFEYLRFLYKNYPKLAGLKKATEKYLRQDAFAAYAKKDYEETLAVLLSLYDLNPRHRGLQKLLETVTNQLITKHLATHDYTAARGVLDLLSQAFPNLSMSNVSPWQEKFEKGAAKQLALARKALDQQQFLAARQALYRAVAILPTLDGADQMLAEIEREAPQVVVGVDHLGGSPFSQKGLDWSARRVLQLTQPKFLRLVGFGAEGGTYDCRWAKMTSDDAGLQLVISLNATALRQGISAQAIALELLRQANPEEPQYRADFAALLRDISIRQGHQVVIRWRHPHVRPEALLSLALRKVTSAASPPGVYQPALDKEQLQRVTYQMPKNGHPTSGPETILEEYSESEDDALTDLLSGEIDVLARVPPWQIARLQQSEGIKVLPYRLPTIHVLVPNTQNPLIGRREFRRALCYAINRPQLLNEILLGGERRAGFRVLSGPLPAGITLTDPVGYAYNQGLQPRSYEPRLAAVLASVARNALAKQEALHVEVMKLKSESQEKTEAAVAPITPLVLAHPPNPVATTVCQSIKLQLEAVGIPIKLKPLDPQGTKAPIDYDLRYAELAIWEPIVDARRLLGPKGLAGNCSSSMSLALQDVDQAKNWKEARSRLQAVHQIAFNDLPVIPLWQTLEFFAHRQSIHGLGSAPVTLYQNVAHWKHTLRGGSR